MHRSKDKNMRHHFGSAETWPSRQQGQRMKTSPQGRKSATTFAAFASANNFGQVRVIHFPHVSPHRRENSYQDRAQQFIGWNLRAKGNLTL